MNKNPKNLIQTLKRLPQFWLFCLAIVIVYIFIRLFFTPHLLSDTYFSRAYYDRNGQLLRLTLSADEKYRIFTPYNQIPPDIIRATILYEDKYFYAHPGINPVALFRATRNYISGNTDTAGASTITMQLARIKYNINTKTIPGKLEQIAAAIYIDAFYSKQEIIEAYLNLAPYGGNIEGIGAASTIYFHRPAQDLSTIQSITLATIPQNPTKRGLNTSHGMTTMAKMRNDLVRRWLSKYPDDTNLSTMVQMPLSVYGISDLPFHAPHFTDRQITHDKSVPQQPDSIITTTLDLDLQNHLERTLRHQVSIRKHMGVKNASAILLNYKTMQVLSYIGSVNYFDESILGQNDGVIARRSPGSTLKPLIYASAIADGHIHSMTLLKDARINFGVYAPENSDSEFYGPVLARDALTHSRNIPAINLVRQIGLNKFYKTLSDSGVSNLKPPSHYGISIALGGAEVSMYELADIYATMANLGTRRNIKMRTSAPDEITGHILSPESFFMTLDMLARQYSPDKKIPYATHTPQRITHYWKTGTSSSYRDAWTAGIFGDYVLIVWVGNFDGAPNNAFSGAKTAAPIYFSLADSILEYNRQHNIPTQDNNFMHDDLNIATVEMCADVGGIAGPHCPKSVSAYFIPGVSPIDTSPVYRAVPIDNATGRRACNADPKNTHMVVYEFWDAEYLDMFKRAGIERNTPPPFMPDCELDDISANTSAPLIISPSDGTNHVIVSDANQAQISFMAITQNPDDKIFWFLDDKMIARTKPGETHVQPVSIGSHTIRISTDTGTGTSHKFNVIK